MNTPSSLLALVFTFPLTVSAATLYESSLSSGTGWGVNGTADSAASFGYDYSADAIPEAPNSVAGGSATTGVKLESNITSGSNNSLTIFPTGQSFSGNYTLRFDAWANFDTNAYYNNGAAGTAEFLGGVLGYDGTATDVSTTGVQILSTGDGGSGSDWRVFANGSFFAAADMTAGSRNGADSYYTGFLPSVVPPAGQQTVHGNSVAGSPAFQWLTYEINVFGSTVTTTIEKPGGDRLEIISHDSSLASTDGNIGLTHADFFSSVAAQPSLTFGLIDNVIVTDSVPEPSTSLLVLLSSAFFLRRRR